MGSIAPHTRVAIVTGSAQGIGRSIALRLAEDGLNVVINDIPAKAAQIDEAVAEIKAKSGVKVIAAPADVTNEEAVQAMIATVVEQLGSLDVVCLFSSWVIMSGLADAPLRWLRTQA